MKTEDLENYIPKGDLEGFPKEIIARMLECQEEQGSPRNISVFKKDRTAGETKKGFVWSDTKEDYDFWNEVIRYKNFNLFFEKYPKQNNQDNSQEFIVGDKVIYYLTNKIGTIDEVKKHKFDNDIDIVVDFGNNDICEYEVNSDIIRPFLLHYRDDYNYDVIDFNNLPKRQKAKRWRADRNGGYWIIDNFFEVYEFEENNTDIDDTYNNLGNYFKTKKEAQEVADKLKKYFQELIKSK